MDFKKVLIFLHIWILNPLLNIIPFFLIDVFYDNQSYIGNTLGHPLYLLCWALSSAAGFYGLSVSIWNRMHAPYSRLVHRFLCAGMFISCLIPYASSFSAIINDLHIWLAIFSVAGFIAEWLRYFQFKGILSLWEKALVFVFFICALLLFIPGHITSAAQIAFSFAVNIVLYLLEKSIERDTIPS